LTLSPAQFLPATVAEMLDHSAREIFEVIRWFGERGKVFNVHFRNIKGKKLDFMEAFPDEGDIDTARALAGYRDVGYPYMLMLDHVPQIDGRDPSGGRLRLLLQLHPGAARRAAATTVTAPDTG
jgi:mannonate dehydratase